jgi:hypothetical protein
MGLVMIRIMLSAPVLRAVSRFIAKNDVRYYLKAVCIEATPFRAIAIATDGHKLAAITHLAPELCNTVGADSVNVLIPADIIAAALKTCPARKTAASRIDVVQEDSGAWRIETATGARFDFVPIDHNFPDWRRIITPIAEKQDWPPRQFNPEYVAAFGAAAADLGAKPSHVVMYPGTMQAAIVRIETRDEFFGLLMPVYASHDWKQWATIPEWVAA